MITECLLILLVIAVGILMLLKVLGGVFLLLIAFAFAVPALTGFSIAQVIVHSKKKIITIASMTLGVIATIILLFLSSTLAISALFFGIMAGVLKKY
jgi:hypothetical protein